MDQCETPPSESIAVVEYASLRNEILIRVLIQNALLIMLTITFVVIAMISLQRPNIAWLSCVLFGIVSGSFALQWCHHGAGSVQIKRYIMSVYQTRKGSNWEAWLLENKLNSFLGTRWVLSTKGVFVGLQCAELVLSLILQPEPHYMLQLSAVSIMFVTTLLLFTNPKGSDLREPKLSKRFSVGG
jgi:hypothetical protein